MTFQYCQQSSAKASKSSHKDGQVILDSANISSDLQELNDSELKMGYLNRNDNNMSQKKLAKGNGKGGINMNIE